MSENEVQKSNPGSNVTWDEYFMLQAVMASFKSKDPNTKVGCVFVDHKNHQVSMGYNGHIAGLNEKLLPWGNDKSLPLDQQKYGFVVHSEANAILHAKTSLEGAKVYVTLFPCHECAKMIATAGVKEVIFLSDKYSGSVENIIAKKILELSSITYRKQSLSEELISRMTSYFQKLALE
ncbi:MAG: deoxycytidylate deaminase [Bacteriovoracaceae bacterium]